MLLLGCFGTISSLLVVGFASNFWVALAGRVLGGLLNGNIGVIQTMVGELVKRPEHERELSIYAFGLESCSLISKQQKHMLSCHSFGVLAQS